MHVHGLPIAAQHEGLLMADLVILTGDSLSLGPARWMRNLPSAPSRATVIHLHPPISPSRHQW